MIEISSADSKYVSKVVNRLSSWKNNVTSQSQTVDGRQPNPSNRFVSRAFFFLFVTAHLVIRTTNQRHRLLTRGSDDRGGVDLRNIYVANGKRSRTDSRSDRTHRGHHHGAYSEDRWKILVF